MSRLLALSLTCLAVASALASPPEDGPGPSYELVARWTFDEHAAPGRDTSGAHPGALRGDARVEGGALHLGGGEDAMVVPDAPALHLRGPLTLAARVRPEKLRGLHTIVNKWYARDAYMLLVQDGKYAFSLAWPGGKWGVTRYLMAPATRGTWADVVGVYDGRAMTLYVDGEHVAGLGDLPPGPLQDSGRPVVIGNHPSWNAFEGAIDEVRLYRGAVPAEDIPDLLESDPPPPPSPPPAPSPRPARSWFLDER